jgi:hypothetical protein
MNVLQKLMLAWKGRDVVAQMAQAGKGWKTIHFWVTLVGSLLSYMAALKGVIPPNWALIITTVLTASYNIMRGMDKAVDDKAVTPWYKTTEGWLGIGAQIQNALVTMQTGDVGTNHLAEANTILTGIMVVARDLAHIEPAEVKAEMAAQPEPAKSEK